MRSISFLIPTYNDICTELVFNLHKQASTLNIDFEIIVADDGSTINSVIEANRSINSLANCRYIERERNAGRAAIRNFLAKESKKPWLLFIDGDMTICRDNFAHVYATTAGDDIIIGGYSIGEASANNLRYVHEKRAEQSKTLLSRQQSPYKDFHTSNFMIRRDIILAHPFDERFRHYGYEDVFLGKKMKDHGISIVHIDNPVGFETFEDNLSFVVKTEEALNTLHQFRKELMGYSKLIETAASLERWHLASIVRFWHKLFGRLERNNLIGDTPKLWMFNIYRLGYYLSLNKQ